ncbi:hypothetical protein BI364_06085 [Acidihalobacter yilgarnensis]|uniref:DUF929 domain-containing protein n=1 Tax=Acidihalobacter yilgarnensis TaxID=2819280 RepID=A0A1D8IME0_9GAMM|nr:DUF929 family protein [Acidihalobacter yilgarnensis]AOU97585.1 hypothetical protein BI364_06085 [Acidihalobacter yilgarnensis]
MRHFRIASPSRLAAMLASLPLVAAFAANAGSLAPPRASAALDQPLAPAIVKHLEQASHDGLAAKRAPDYTSIQSINGPNPGQAASKSTVLYVGADYCPFCAALRWPLTIALMRFGDFQGLRTMRSSPKDVYPDTTTVTFAKASYTSRYVDFIPVETADRLGHPLDPLKGQPAKLFQEFDAAPYTAHPNGIPFLYIGGRWLLLGSPVNPDLYAKLDWAQIAEKLADPKGMLTRVVIPQANLITAAICQTTAQKPAEVCKSPGVQAAAEMLPPTS